jgi:uncharacterized protein (TIGR02270 family)
MASALAQVHAQLYREHLDEASFLYGQRLDYVHDPEVNWPDLGDWEARFEAHLDALVLGGEPALAICRQQAAAGEPGELHTAMRVFCRSDRKADAFEVLRSLDPADEDAARAVSHALRDTPRAWRDDLLQLFQRDQGPLTGVLAQVIGYRRFASEDLLQGKLAANPPVGAGDVAWALGRVGGTGSAPLLWPLLDGEDGHVSEAVAIAMMRIGDRRPLQRALQLAGKQTWARRVLGIGGGFDSVHALLGLLKEKKADAAAVLAIGMLGHLSAVVPLVELLDDDDLSREAGAALNTITGAQLYADVFVPDTFDRDELTDEEREAFDRDGTLPTRKGEPYGNFERRPLPDQAAWRTWLEQNKHRFNRQLRWRMGKPYGPSALLECLRSETSPFAVRSATYEELVVRYGLDVPFEVDLPVDQQQKFLDKIEAWVATQSSTFEAGRWYFAGELQA